MFRVADYDEDWYEDRHLLQADMVFVTHGDDIVKLDRRVPGDGTKWYVANYFHGHFSYEDDTIEPGDLKNRLEYMEEDNA